MRATWTDSRLDDLARRMDDGFRGANRRMDDGFRRVDEDLREVRGEIAAVNGRFDSLQRTLIQVGGGLIASFVGLIIAFVLTQH